MNKINSILESLSEGMLTTAVARGKGDVTDFFSDLLKGKVLKGIDIENNINKIYETDSRAVKVYRSKPIKSKTVKNLTFNELPKDYQSFIDKVDRVFRVSANVMYDTDSRRACLNVEHCIRTFFRKWFKLNTTADFRKYLVNDTRLISCIKVDSVSIGDSRGMDWVLSFGFDVVDREQFKVAKSYLIDKVDYMSCHEDFSDKVEVDFYIF